MTNSIYAKSNQLGDQTLKCLSSVVQHCSAAAGAGRPRRVPSRIVRTHARSHARTLAGALAVDVASFIALLPWLRGTRSSGGPSPPDPQTRTGPPPPAHFDAPFSLFFSPPPAAFAGAESREHARRPGGSATADKAATSPSQMHFIFIGGLQPGTEEQRCG